MKNSLLHITVRTIEIFLITVAALLLTRHQPKYWTAFFMALGLAIGHEIDASPAVSPEFKKGYTIISIILLAAFAVLLIYIKLFP